MYAGNFDGNIFEGYSPLSRLIHTVDFVLALFELRERLLLFSRTGLCNGEFPEIPSAAFRNRDKKLKDSVASQ